MNLDLSRRGEGSVSEDFSDLPPTVIAHKTTIEVIGGIDGETFFREFFANDFSPFDGKVVVDIGAGCGNTLDTLAKNGNPKRLVAVDPIYGRVQAKAQFYTMEILNQVRTKAISNLGKKGNYDRFPWADPVNEVSNTELQQKIIRDFCYQDRRIERYQELPKLLLDIGIFMSTLYAIPNAGVLLSQIDELLSPDGSIYIVDFKNARGNNPCKVLKDAGIEITIYNQYFFATLKKGDAKRLQW